MCSTLLRKLIKEHSEEIRNVRTLDYSSPSWTRATLINDKAITWAKPKACVYADSVLCIGRMEQSPGAAEARWKGQIEDLRKYSSHQDAVGLDGEAIEFEWKNFPRFLDIDYSSRDPARLGGEAHQARELQRFGSSSCLCSMTFCENQMIRIASRTMRQSRVTRKILPGHWTFLGPGSEKRWYGDSQGGQWDRTANKKVQHFKETCHPIFISTSGLSRGILIQRKGESTSHINGDSMNTELLFQKINSVNQVSTNWCYKFALKKNEKHISTPVDNRILAIVEPEEVEMLISSPNRAQGNLMVQSEAKFRVLEKKCEKALFQHLVTAGNCYRVRPGDDDGWGKLLLYAENIRVLELIRKLELWQQFPQIQIWDQSWRFMS